LLSLPSTLCRHSGLLFGERLDTLFTSSDKRNIQIHPSTRYRIRCGFIFFRFGPVHTLSDSLRIYIFHSEERIYFFPDSLSNSPDTCGRSAAVSGKKKLRIRKYPDTTANPEKNKSALQSGKKYICNESDNVWTGPEWKKNKSATNPITCGRVNPDIFLSDDVKSVSSLSPNNKPKWRHNVEVEQSKFPATISLYGACSKDILVQRSLGY